MKETDVNFKKSVVKVRAFASDILEQCQNKGLTVLEVQLLSGEITRQVDVSVEKWQESELFLK